MLLEDVAAETALATESYVAGVKAYQRDASDIVIFENGIRVSLSSWGERALHSRGRIGGCHGIVDMKLLWLAGDLSNHTRL